MDLGNVVQFSSHRRPFVLTETYCSNPDCTCNEVFLKFTEVSNGKYPLTNPISFSVRVDLETWQERKPPRRAAEISDWVREFLQQCPATRRAEFKASYEEGRRIARRRAEYTMDAGEVLEGALLSYADILTDKSSLSAGGNAYTFDVHYQGRDYLVEDRYCANPSCKCKAVHLEFFESVSQPDGKQRIYQRFLGRVTFAGRLIVEKRMNQSLAEAKAVLSAWWTQYGGDLQLLKERYREVKEIGQRSLDAQPSRRSAVRTATLMSEDMSLDDGPAANVRAGRNDPCPCGSGKKYKKCCWRRATLPV